MQGQGLKLHALGDCIACSLAFEICIACSLAFAVSRHHGGPTMPSGSAAVAPKLSWRGTIRRPGGLASGLHQECFYVPQKPYNVLGTLVEQLTCEPSVCPPGSFFFCYL